MVACRMKETYNEHHPVLLNEVIENLAIQPDGVYLDATFGRGGHAQAILKQLGPEGRLLAMDKDPEAVAYARTHFADEKRFMIQHGSFAEMGRWVAKQNLIGKINGILLDLGVSSPQLDDPDRGFSFKRAGKLDMRMDHSRGVDAASWIANRREPACAMPYFNSAMTIMLVETRCSVRAIRFATRPSGCRIRSDRMFVSSR